MSSENPSDKTEIHNNAEEKVTIYDVLRQAPVDKIKEIGPLTRVGFYMALLLLLYLTLVTGFLLMDYWRNIPHFPQSSIITEVQLSQYQQASEFVTERTLKLLDALVLKGFLPVFTAILGYIFGTRGADRGES